MSEISNGINLEGFGNTMPAGKHNIDGKYSPATGSFPSASDKSSQGSAGLTNKMVHSVEETRSFGAGN